MIRSIDGVSQSRKLLIERCRDFASGDNHDSGFMDLTRA